MIKTLLLSCCLLVAACASCPPVPPKVQINPPLLAEFTIPELEHTPDSVVEKIGLYVADVVGYIRKVNSLPCVEGQGEKKK